MLLQLPEAVMFLIWLIVATILVALIMYLAVYLVDSKMRASDRKWMILLVAFIAVLIIPVIVGALDQVLQAIGDLLAGIRDAIDGGGQNFLIRLSPIIAFLLLLVIVRWLISDSWEKSLWISLITYFILFLFYCILPELYNFIASGILNLF